MDYRQTIDFLFNSLPEFQNIGSAAYKPGLTATISFNTHLGSPDTEFVSIHVAGTNGKGSVSHIIASVLQSAGYKVGLYTSPHLKDFRERIKVDGQMITESDVVEFVKQHKTQMLELNLSFFEMTVGMAFDYFRRQNVEVAVIETGLGGRLDSTNIVSPILSIITNIGLDHMTLLGDTIPKIAYEKAGIIKRETPVVIGESDPLSDPVFKEKASQMCAPLIFADQAMFCKDIEQDSRLHTVMVTRQCDGAEFWLQLDLLGDYQKQNIVTVCAALDTLHKLTHISVSRRALIEGCREAATKTSLMGRWQIIGHNPLTVCDTGHNEHGLRIVIDQIKRHNFDKLYMILGFVNDKDLSKILPLLPNKAHYIFTQASIERALPAEILSAQAKKYNITGEVVVGVKEALAKAQSLAKPQDMIFVGGSTFTVAEII